MSKPNIYLEVEVPKKLNLENLEVLRKRVFEGEIRPAFRGADIGDEYHLCLYVGQANLQNAGGNYLLPSSGIIQLTREDGSILPDDEWYYLRILEKQFAELDATDSIVVVQSGEMPELPGRFSSAWRSADAETLPSTPSCRAVEFETFDGSPLSAVFIGELTEELAGEQVRLDRVFVSCDIAFMFTPDELRRYEQELVIIDGPVTGAVSRLSDAAWSLQKPKRRTGYNMHLYQLLKAAHDAGKPYPTSDDVLQAWKESPPPDSGISVSDGLRKMTYTGLGKYPKKTADAEAISKAISRLA
jgi:hypothetical protein